MIWLTWRQHRIEALVGGVVLVLLVPLLLMTGFTIASAYQDTGMAACIAQHAICLGTRNVFIERFRDITLTIESLNTLPVLVGMFVGAPLLARELEQGTHRLAWTQSITRFRWLAMKLNLLIGATLLAFVALAILMTWWSGPWNAIKGPWETYNLQGMVPISTAIFGLALGIAVGTLLRRSVPAMAITLAVCALLLVTMAGLVRPHLLPPLSYTWPYGQLDPRAYQGDLSVSQTIVDRQGHQLSNVDLGRICQPPLDKTNRNAEDAWAKCEADHGVRYLSFYQPADRFWLFQGMETTIFLMLAVGLIALTTWWVRRRIA